jgi:hypothetical protein
LPGQLHLKHLNKASYKFFRHFTSLFDCGK